MREDKTNGPPLAAGAAILNLWTAPLVWWLAASPLFGQVVRLPAVMPPSEASPSRLVSYPDSSVELPQAPLELPSPIPERPPDARDGLFQKLNFTTTWLASGGAYGLGETDMELRTILAFPIPSRDWPLIVTPGFGVHYLDGPTVSDLPARVYDAYTQFRWLRGLPPRFGIDLAITPGVFSDFEQGTDEALRITGHAAGLFTWTRTAKIVVGVAYLDREDVGVLPIGGLVWTPHEDVKFELVVPRPRIARRLYWAGASTENVQDWLYVAGEFGEGTWAIRRANTSNDVATYRDFRVLLGLERKAIGGLDGRLEIGYVFGRKLQYNSITPDVNLSDTVMLRGGVTY